MTTSHEELRKLAEAATPGPWIGAGPSFGASFPKYMKEVCVDREGDEDDGYSICRSPIGLDAEASADMAYIAAANPQTILKLLDEIEALKAHAEAYPFRGEIEALRKDAERYSLIRRGQHWSVVDGIGNTLRAENLDEAIDRAMEGK